MLRQSSKVMMSPSGEEVAGYDYAISVGGTVRGKEDLGFVVIDRQMEKRRNGARV
jgi:hypothetical protein